MPTNVRSTDVRIANPHRRALRVIKRSGLPFVVAGAFALYHYTGIIRDTKDLDLFVEPSVAPDVLRALRDAGFKTCIEAQHWLGKALWDEYMVDVIYGSGNWVVPVDRQWIDRAESGTLLGEKVPIAPIEEMIWTKCYVAHRERYDGADVLHLIWAQYKTIDWQHLLERFGDHWELLLSYLMLFRFVYPSDTDRLPRAMMEELVRREREEQSKPPQPGRVCRGTMLDRYQFLYDIEVLGYHDSREEYAEAAGYSTESVAADRRIASEMLQKNLVRPSHVA